MDFKAAEWVFTTPTKGSERDSGEGQIPLPHSPSADVPVWSKAGLHHAPASVKKLAIAAGVYDAEVRAALDRNFSVKTLKQKPATI